MAGVLVVVVLAEEILVIKALEAVALDLAGAGAELPTRVAVVVLVLGDPGPWDRRCSFRGRKFRVS